MKRIYVDMDGVLCDFATKYFAELNKNPSNKYPHSQYGFFLTLEEIPEAIESFKLLSQKYDVWVLTRPSRHNPLCYTEKRLWIENHLSFDWTSKLIISPDKTLLMGDYLIDDNPWPGFQGEQILFGSESFPDWATVRNYLL